MVEHRRSSPMDVSPGAWGNASTVPGSATLNVGLNAGVYSISCSSSGNCSAAGQYTDASNHSQAFVADETNGVWGTAIEVPGTAALNAGGNAAAWSVSCSSAGNCGAAGSYTDNAGDIRGFVVNETGGTWADASEVIDPDSIGSSKALGVESISCTATGSCTAVGDVIVSGGGSVGFAVSETGGEWSGVTEMTINSPFGFGGTSLDNVSCTAPGECSAAGNGLYPDAAVSGGYANIPFESVETDGSWSPPIDFPGLSTLNVGENSFSNSISCASPGNCSAGGSYQGTTAASQAWVSNETNGTWSDAIQVPGYSTYNSGDAALNAISCTALDYCVATGFYTDESGDPIGFIDSDFLGSWGSAYAVTFEAGPYADGTGSIGEAVSCAAYDCAVAGVSFQASGNAQAFVELTTGGQFAIVVPGSGALNTAGDGYASSVSCNADSSCAVGGWYSTSTNDYQAFTSDMTPAYLTQVPLKITTTRGKVGTSLRLSTSGGSGTGPVTYSVANGSAKGCTVSDGFLTSTTAGSCEVTATKGFDLTYLPLSSTSAIEMAYPPRPLPVMITFAGTSTVLSSSARTALSRLSQRLITGAFITVTGDANGNGPLARRRAVAVRSYLSMVFGLHVTIKTDAAVNSNSVTVVTTRE